MSASRRRPIPYLLTLLLSAGALDAQDVPDTRAAAVASQGVELGYAVGADLSFLKAAEDRGVQFKDGGVVKPGLEIFRDHGYDWIRLRVFHSPLRARDSLPNDLAYTVELAKDAKARGFKFLLDLHYADSWADPQKQPIPAAWDTTDVEVLADSVFAYTAHVIRALREAGAMPEMVQIGNEVRNGMMWPLGKLPENWDDFALLFRAGLDGVDAGRGRAPRPLILLHYDNGADVAGAKAFFDRFHAYGIPYDVIGFSYYPWWHGTLIDLRENLLAVLDRYPDKDVMLVEVGYRPGVYEYENRPPPFAPDAPGGPRTAFLEAVNETLLRIPSTRIKGIFWWEPAMGCDSDFFDEDCEARPVIRVFDRYTRR
jgi:arabinogalactan endo-1,4-beta-galactosidase